MNLKVFKLLKSKKGFTLIEVVVVVTLLVIVLIPSFIMFIFGSRAVGLAKERNLAISFAQERIEEIRNMTFSNITSANLPDDSKVVGGLTFSRHVDVQGSPSEVSGTNGDIKRITITISWTSTTGESKNISLTTYRYKES